jgi:hypothetical protein
MMRDTGKDEVHQIVQTHQAALVFQAGQRQTAPDGSHQGRKVGFHARTVNQ